MCRFSNRKNKKILVFSWKIWNYVIYFSCYNLFKRKVDHFIMGFIENIIEKAKSDKKTVVLSEATDKRILKAANMAIDAGTADIILVGNENEIKKEEQNLLREIL